MKNTFKNLGLVITLSMLLFGCDNKELSISTLDCKNKFLETIDDGKDCSESNLFVCETIEVPDLIALENQDLEWIPMFCNEIGETITYKNDANQSFDIKITDRNHYINKLRVSVGCDVSMEHVSYVCQKNETAFIEFSSSIFGNNLTSFEIYRRIIEVEEGNLGSPKLGFTLEQPRANSAVHNFIFRVTAGDETENRARNFHDELTLNNETFTDVYEFLIRETFHSEPHISIYTNKGNGILGFKKDSKFWLRDN